MEGRDESRHLSRGVAKEVQEGADAPGNKL